MAQKQFKIGLSNTDKQNMAQDVYERVLALTFAEYDSAETYNKGDFVVYNDLLYKCLADNVTGTWDATKWQQATLQDVVDDVESAVATVNNKANVDGNYPTMTVGMADNLTPYDESAGDDQDEPFILQATGTGNGSQPDFSTGSAGLMKEKQGNTVVVNQRLDYTPISTGEGGGNVYKWADKVVVGHKYLIYTQLDVAQSIQIWESENKTNAWAVSENSVGVEYFTADTPAYKIITITTYTNLALRSAFNTTVANKTWQPFVIDLTQWFNGDIPQDVLDNPSNFFRYYQGSLAYNEGTLVNANGRYIKCIGMNQWDEEWEVGSMNNDGTNNNSYTDRIRSKNYIRVNPNTIYYFYAGSGTMTVYYYDKDQNFIKEESNPVTNTTFITPSNCSYIRFRTNTVYGTTYNNDISINLYYEDEPRCLTYEPYQVLTNNDTGTEVLRKASNAHDVKLPSGEITRRIGYVDLGTLTWTKAEISNEKYAFRAVVSGIKPTSDGNEVPNVICSKYVALSRFDLYTYTKQGVTLSLWSITDSVTIYDSSLESGDAAAFKTAMSGVYLFYELAEPTTEQGTPYSENLVIDDFGSMDFDSDVPQDALIFYPVDYKAFVDTLYKYSDGTPSNLALNSELNAKFESYLKSLSGYDASATQVLKNVEGTLTWVTEGE